VEVWKLFCWETSPWPANMAPLMGGGPGVPGRDQRRHPPLKDPLDLSRLMVARDAVGRDWSQFMAEHR